jgi:hypothetical protein
MRQTTQKGLVIITGVLILTWLAFMGATYLEGHIEKLISGIGQIEEAFQQNVAGRVQGSVGHVFTVRVRILMTLFIWGLAAFGIFRRMRKGYWDIRLLLLSIAPFMLFALQFYGGEMMLRVYFFSLPFIAFFAAASFYPKVTIANPWQKGMGLGLVSLVLIAGFFVSRYGNEVSYQYTADEIKAIRVLYEIAEPGDLIAAPSPQYPIKFQDYEKYPQLFITSEILAGDVYEIFKSVEKKNKGDTYLIITRSQIAYFYLFYNYPPGNWVGLEKELIDSKLFHLIYSNDDAKIYQINS